MLITIVVPVLCRTVRYRQGGPRRQYVALVCLLTIAMMLDGLQCVAMHWPAGSFTFMASDLGPDERSSFCPPHLSTTASGAFRVVVDRHRPTWSTTTTWYVLKKGLVGEPEKWSVERGTIGLASPRIGQANRGCHSWLVLTAVFLFRSPLPLAFSIYLTDSLTCLISFFYCIIF
jgi:hypothetical protein